METQQQVASPVAIGMRFGLLITAIGIIIDFLLRITGINVIAYGATAFTTGLLVAIVGVVFAHRAFRQANAGLMTYSQGIMVASIAIMIWAIASSVFNYLYVNYIDPDFVSRMKDELIAFMERNRVPDSQIAKSTAQFDEMSPPLGKALVKGLTNGVVMGIVLGLIISAFTKRKPADFD